MPGRVASTVARPAERRQIYAAAKFAGAIHVVDPLADSFPPRSRIETTRRIGSRPKLPRYQANVEYWGSSGVNPDQFHPRAICYFPSLVTFALPDRNIGVDATQARQHEFLRQKLTYVGASGSGRRTIGRRRTVDQEGKRK